MKGKVSIIIPVYNVEKYLDRCVKSVVEQTYRNIEIILVNDGSLDRCAEICDGWGRRDNRIKIIHKKNEGLSQARNDGLLLSSGEYVLFVDSDDWLRKDAIEKMLCLQDKNKCDVIFFYWQNVLENGDVPKSIQHEMVMNNKFPDDVMASRETVLMYLLERRIENYSWGFITSKNLYIDNDIFFPKGRMFEDISTTYKIICNSTSFSFINEPLYFYNNRDDSLSRKKKIKMDFLYNWVQSIDEMCDMIMREFCTLRKDACRYKYIMLVNAYVYSYLFMVDAEETELANFRRMLKNNLRKIDNKVRLLDIKRRQDKMKCLLYRMHLLPAFANVMRLM